MTCREQRLPNEILAPILQYSAWERSKSDQLGIMLVSSAAFESISWVLYHDIILLERVTESKVQGLVSCMKRLGSKYFAHRVCALWIDILPPGNSVDPEHTVSQYSRALHLPFIISTCRNIRHLRLFASTHLDALLQSALARPKLEFLTLSEAFYEPIRGVDWAILLAGYPTPAMNSITHFTMELPWHWVIGGSPPFIALFTSLTHACFHVTRELEVWPEPFMPNLMRKRGLEQVSFVDRPPISKNESHSLREDMWGRWLSRGFWDHGIGLTGSVPVQVLHDVPVFGTLEEWRSLVLVGRFPEMEKNCVWHRVPWVKV
ncbi:hypothetical protein DL96DRAFT_1626132 [Flagelloscypha sp. PMI_526]|nr:hypothetical protein DL96DRAFT_1626132 [Flagelloscypha sp. PMI_526]